MKTVIVHKKPLDLDEYVQRSAAAADIVQLVDEPSIIIDGDSGIDCADVGVNKGGLQLFDREEMAQKEIKIIRKELYPALQLRETKNKAWSVEPALKGALFNTKKLWLSYGNTYHKKTWTLCIGTSAKLLGVSVV